MISKNLNLLVFAPKNIRLTDEEGLIECSIDGMKDIVLKTEFIKKKLIVPLGFLLLARSVLTYLDFISQ